MGLTQNGTGERKGEGGGGFCACMSILLSTYCFPFGCAHFIERIIFIGYAKIMTCGKWNSNERMKRSRCDSSDLRFERTNTTTTTHAHVAEFQIRSLLALVTLR